MKNKRGIATWIAIATIIGLMASVWTLSNTIDIKNLGATITGSGEYIERPVFYYDKCEQVGDLKYSTVMNFRDAWVSKPSVTDEYSVSFINLKYSKTMLLDIYSGITISVCNSQVLNENNCKIFKKYYQVPTSQEIKITGIRPNEYVYAEYKIAGLTSLSTATGQYQVSFQPYALRQYNVLSGSSAQINPNDCSYSSTQKDTIISEDLSKVSAPSGIKTNENTLQPNEIRWYVAGYVTSAKPSFMLTYAGKDAWCRTTGSSGEIYAINEIKTLGGTYKVASADYSDYLGSVTCCPTATMGDKVCSANFKWETIQGTECGLFKSCGSPNWVPSSSQTLIKYSCKDGYCNSQTKDVECASDYDCSDSNEVCDLNSYTCKKANINLNGQVIETIPDSQQSCDEKGGRWVTQTTEDKSFWNWVGIGEPDIITTEYCDMSSPINWTFWILLIIAIIVIIVFFPQIWGGIRVLLSKMGLRI